MGRPFEVNVWVVVEVLVRLGRQFEVEVEVGVIVVVMGCLLELWCNLGSTT
jgi:hypothetical protein